MEIRILNQNKDRTADTIGLEKKIESILDFLDIPNAEVSVLLTDDEQMHAMNLEYRGFDKPTDVLSFSLLEGEYGDVAPDMLGDVVISTDTAKRQAASQAHSFEKEMNALIVHGILHLLGYDHEQDEDQAELMRSKEDEILAIL